jgi:hypothetical protein
VISHDSTLRSSAGIAPAVGPVAARVSATPRGGRSGGVDVDKMGI